VLARPHTEGLKTEMICDDYRIQELIPQHLLDCRKAIKLSLKLAEVLDDYDDKDMMVPEIKQQGDPAWAGGAMV